jgi:hypothetical protein
MRSPTDYLKDSWSGTPSGDTNASGAEETPHSDRNNPYRIKMPESPEWGLGKDGGTSFGHSDTVEENKKAARWDMTLDEVAKGYSKPGDDAGEPGTASYPQSIPDTNVHDRGAGSDAYAREHSATTGRGFDGRGRPKSTSNPGGQTIGSRENLG